MTEAIDVQAKMDPATLLKIATGDTSKLSPQEKIQLIVQVCEIAGLDPRLAPFEFIKFQGKETMYAKKNAADQLVNVHKIKLDIVDDKMIGHIYRVRCKAETKDGRATMDDGCVNTEGVKGDALANAMMRCVTKAKRRTVLSVCGLSLLDESEIETIPGAKVVPVPTSPAQQLVDAATAAAAQQPLTDFEKEWGKEPPPSQADLEKATIAKLSRVKKLLKLRPAFKEFCKEILGRDVAAPRDLSLGDIALLEEAAAGDPPDDIQF